MNDPTVTGQLALPLLSELDRDMIRAAAMRCEEFLRLSFFEYSDNSCLSSCCRRRASGEAMFALAIAEGRA